VGDSGIVGKSRAKGGGIGGFCREKAGVEGKDGCGYP